MLRYALHDVLSCTSTYRMGGERAVLKYPA